MEGAQQYMLSQGQLQNIIKQMPTENQREIILCKMVQIFMLSLQGLTSLSVPHSSANETHFATCSLR